MDIILTQIISLTAYKLASLATGAFLCYLGYKLFMAGVRENAGSAAGGFGDSRIIISRAAPGTFFVLMGAVVIGLTIAKGMDFESFNSRGGRTNEKPALID